MITLQYVNDLAVFTANHNKKTGVHELGSIAKRLMKNPKFKRVFVFEYNNVFRKEIL